MPSDCAPSIETRPKWYDLAWGTAALVASAAMFFLGSGLRPWWWLTWFASLPVLCVSSRIGAWPAFMIAALAWSIGSLNMWDYMTRVLQTPTIATLLFVLVPGCIYGAAVLLFRRFVQRGELWRATLAFPAAWVSWEYLTYWLSPHGTFPNLGYSQMDCLPVLQVVSLTGIWGISFCLFLLSALVASLCSSSMSLAPRMMLAATAVILFAMVIAYGAWRLYLAPPAEHFANIGLLATDVDGRFPGVFPQDDETALELLRRYSDQVGGLLARDAQVIVFPEKIALLSDEATKVIDHLYEAAAERIHAHIVVGLDRGSKTSRSNEARVYSPKGEFTGLYVKHHLLSPFEDVDRRGTQLTLLNEASGVWGIEICKDMDFPALSRRYGAAGVGLLLVPAWDFVADGWLHGRMAIMRGVESGFAIARVARQGQLTVSDNRGRLLGETSSVVGSFASLVVRAPVANEKTVYVRWGDYFAWANVVGLLFVLFSRYPKM
jgi:apolipoprotein N-acyltransferase